MKALHFIKSTPSSKCSCGVDTLLVWSRKGGLITRNCLKCGKPDWVALHHVPKVPCEFCKLPLEIITKEDDKNYWYVCSRCKRQWKLADELPHWSELFEYSGLAAYGDYTEAAH